MINILLVDDHISVAEGTRALLEQNSDYMVSVCYSPLEVIEKLPLEKFDLFLFDLYMPEINGIELSKKVLEIVPEAKIIIYTGYDINTHFNVIVESGISGIVSKAASIKQFMRAIECAINNEVLIPIDIFRSLRKSYDVNITTEEDKTIKITLNEREQSILQYVSKGLTNREIANHLLISQRLVEYGLTSIYQKLQVKSRTEALVKATEYKLLNTIS